MVVVNAARTKTTKDGKNCGLNLAQGVMREDYNDGETCTVATIAMSDWMMVRQATTFGQGQLRSQWMTMGETR